jgi:hypothetical protein
MPRVGSVNRLGTITAVRIDKPGIVYKNHEELGKIIVKDGRKYMLTGLVHNAPRGSNCFTTLMWKYIEPDDNWYE